MAQDSAYTSTRQIPSAFKAFELGPVNLDVGGGRFEDGTQFLSEHGVTNLVWDRFNRSERHNKMVMNRIQYKGCDTITVLNVLNVIDADERKTLYNEVLFLSLDNNHAPIIFQVYEGNRTGIRDTGKTVQNNMKTSAYESEVNDWFKHTHTITRWKNFIIVEPKEGI